jgi:hypothetical protein
VTIDHLLLPCLPHANLQIDQHTWRVRDHQALELGGPAVRTLIDLPLAYLVQSQQDRQEKRTLWDQNLSVG